MNDANDVNGSGRRRPIRKSVVVVAIGFVGIAVLLILAGRRGPGEQIELADPADEFAIVELDTMPVTEAEISVSVESPAALAIAAALVPAQPVRIVVLPVRSDRLDPAEMAFVESIRQSMLAELQSSPDVDEVIPVSAAEYAAAITASAGRLRDERLRFLILVRQYPGADVVEMTVDDSGQSGSGWIHLTFNQQPGLGGFAYALGATMVNPAPEQDAQRLGLRLAAYVIDGATAPPIRPRNSVAAPRTVIADASRPEDERLLALSQLSRDVLDEGSIAAAIELGTRGESAETRKAIWSMLRQNVYDPGLASPLSYVLLSDPDPAVRAEAALALAWYVDSGGTRGSLAHAMRTDGSPEVRLAARLATMTYDERQAFSREALLDRSLSPDERFAPTKLIGAPRQMTYYRPPGGNVAEDETALAYAEILAGSEDPDVRLQALSALRARRTLALFTGSAQPEILEALIAVASDESRAVRELALGALASYVGNPEVRDLLETALEREELDGSTRFSVAQALMQSDR